jgi:hypothetical protein
METRSDVAHERRPQGEYYEMRTELLSQGDVFVDVPLAYPSPATEIVIEERAEETRLFLSGPLDFGPAILITPTCSMRSQTDGRSYAHPVRTLVPLRPVEELLERGVLDTSKRGLAEKRDSLINYMWFPALRDAEIPDSLALLYMPVTVHHDMVVESRVAQLTHEAAQQLQKKLAWHMTSMLIQRREFDPPMD